MLGNSAIRANARMQLKGNWGLSLAVCLLYSLILSAVSSTGVGALILGGSLQIGLILYFLALMRGNNPRLELLFDGFKSFTATLGIYLWYTLWVLIWSLLLIIPGIIKSLSYSMSFYITADNPNIGIKNSLNISKKMMHGYKGKLFMLYLSFIGWAFLCILSLGIGLLWLTPYIQASVANFYAEVRRESINNNVCTEEELIRINM